MTSKDIASLAAPADRMFVWLARHRDRLRRFGLIASLLVFVGGLAMAVSAVPDVLHRLTAAPLVILLVVCMPIQAALNAAEFKLMTRYGGHRVDWMPALEVSVYTSAANMLPLPGGIFTRLAAMRSYGIGFGKGSLVVALGLALWGGVAFAYSGAWLLHDGGIEVGAAFLGIAALFIGPAMVGCRRLDRSPALLLQVLLVRLAALTLEAARMALAIYALGATIDFHQASVFVVASFLGAIVSIAPAGLGVREVVIAALAPFVGVDVAIGFLSATVNRAVGMAGLAIIIGLLLGIRRKGTS